MRILPLVLILAAAARADTSPRGSSWVPKQLGLQKTIVPKSGELYGAAMSPDGRRFAVAGADGSVRILSTSTWKEERKVGTHNGGAWSVAWSPDGRKLATGGLDNRALIFDAATGRELKALNGHTSYVYAVAFSPDGKRIVTGGADSLIKVWSVETGAEEKTLAAHGSYVSSVAFSRDGKTLASASYDATVKIWDTETWNELRTLTGHTNSVMALAFSRDGRRLATASSDSTVRIWDPATAREEKSFTTAGVQATAVAWSVDGRWVIGATGRVVRLWDAKTGAEAAALAHHSNDIYGLAASDTVLVTASVDLSVKVWSGAGVKKLKPKGFFGVSVQTGQNGEGCVVSQVLVGTAAEQAGMQVGDVILAVNGVRVADHQEAIAQIGGHSEGDEVEFLLKRGGQEMKLKAKLGKRPDNQ